MTASQCLLRCAASIALLSTISISPLPAQTPAPSPNGNVCVSRTNVEQGSNGEVSLKIRSSELAKFSQRGFRVRDCNEVRTSVAKAAGHMCEIAALKDTALEREFEARHGVTPSEICEIGRR